jgi:CHAD domain-containing protein
LKHKLLMTMNGQIRKLHAGVHDAEFDRHQLRILVKRTRYLTDAFPSLSPLPNDAAASLKKAQAALGAWHDHFQWCLRVQQEDELESLAQKWADAAEQELEVAETALKKLARLLPSE